MTRRITKLVAIYLLLGLVATVAVAWGSAWTMSPNRLVRHIHDREGPPYRSAWEFRCWGGMRYELQDALDDEMLEWERQQDPTQAWMEFDVEWPHVASSLIAYDDDGNADATVVVEARGWPWIAVRCELDIAPELWSRVSRSHGPGYWSRRASQRNVLLNVVPPDLSVQGAIEGPDIRGRFYSPTGTILLPYLPYWPGLIADTLVFALLFVGLHQLVAWGRRKRRRERGHCPTCGYDLTGIDGVCPECGGQP